MSYTTFALSGLEVTPDAIAPDGAVTVSATVQNTGARAGDEVVQLYIRDKAASVTRPVRELKGFQRVRLRPGERRTVRFTLGPDELEIWGIDDEWVVEPGTFDVWVATSSEGGLKGAFSVR